MRRRKSVSAATTPSDAKASPAALPPPDQNPDQIASLKASDVGTTRTLTIDASIPGSYLRLMAAFGTKDQDFFDGLTRQIARVKSRDNASEAINFLFSVVKNTQSRDELEAMLLAQMAACHMIAMDLISRLTDPEEYRLFLKLMKTFADLKETFDRGRKARENSFMVQNMTVRDGGQAIVGNVTQGSAEPTEQMTAASPPRPSNRRAVRLPRVDESLELAPCSPVGEQGEGSHAFGKNDDR